MTVVVFEEVVYAIKTIPVFTAIVQRSELVATHLAALFTNEGKVVVAHRDFLTSGDCL